MSDPRRLRDASSASPAGMRELLAVAKKTRRMSDAERARVMAKMAKIAALPPAPALQSPGAWLGGAAKMGVSMVLVGVSAGALVQPDLSKSHAPTAITRPSEESQRVVPIVESAQALASSPPPVASVIPTPSKPSEPTTPASAAADDRLSREARQLAVAGARVATNPNEALALLKAHREAFPHGMLGIEREVLVIDALLRAGRREEARARGAALLKQSKGSLYEARVRRMLDGGDRR